jgi:hypothetical protein
MANPTYDLPRRESDIDLENGNDRRELTVAEKASFEVPAEIRAASGMKKLDWVFNLPSVERFVTGLAPQELYRWLRDIGKEDAYPLLEYAEPGQIQALIDIDAWTRNELAIPRWLEWLDLALAVDIDTGVRFMAAQDDTTYEWLFTGDIQVLPADTDIDMIPDELAFFNTPDGAYVVTVPREHPLEDRMPHLLRLLWAADMERAQVLFQQAQFELHESCSEEMERFRNARLLDMGFEPPSEAIGVFEVVEIGKLKEALLASMDGEPEEEIVVVENRPVAFEMTLSEAQAPDLLTGAVKTLGARDLAEFSRGFAYLANKVFMAETGDLSRLDDLPDYARYAAAVCNIGLSWLSSESPDLAARIVPRVSPETFFKAGWTQLFAMAKKARKVCKRAGVEQGFGLFGTPTDETIYAAHLVRPLYAEVLDGEGQDKLGHRPIATLEDLARIEAHIAHATDLLDAFEHRFGVTIDALQHAESLALSKDARRRIRLTTLIRTGLANTLLSDGFSFAPLDREGIAAFGRAAFGPGGGLSETMSRLVSGLLAGKDEASREGAALARLVERAMDELVESLGPVEEREVDLRYAGELFLVAS